MHFGSIELDIRSFYKHYCTGSCNAGLTASKLAYNARTQIELTYIMLIGKDLRDPRDHRMGVASRWHRRSEIQSRLFHRFPNPLTSCLSLHSIFCRKLYFFIFNFGQIPFPSNRDPPKNDSNSKAIRRRGRETAAALTREWKKFDCRGFFLLLFTSSCSSFFSVVFPGIDVTTSNAHFYTDTPTTVDICIYVR